MKKRHKKILEAMDEVPLTQEEEAHRLLIAKEVAEKEVKDLSAQLKADWNLLVRINTYGKGLLPAESTYVESFMKWLEGGDPLTEKQRKVAQDIDERRVS